MLPHRGEPGPLSCPQVMVSRGHRTPRGRFSATLDPISGPCAPPHTEGLWPGHRGVTSLAPNMTEQSAADGHPTRGQAASHTGPGGRRTRRVSTVQTQQVGRPPSVDPPRSAPLAVLGCQGAGAPRVSPSPPSMSPWTASAVGAQVCLEHPVSPCPGHRGAGPPGAPIPVL